MLEDTSTTCNDLDECCELMEHEHELEEDHDESDCTPAKEGETAPARKGETAPARKGETAPATEGRNGVLEDTSTACNDLAGCCELMEYKL